MSVGTLGDGVGQSIWSAPAGAGRGVFGACAVGGFSVTLDNMREIVWMAENWSFPSLANGVGVGFKRASASARADAVAALV